MPEITPQDPETIRQHFECFIDMYPDPSDRLRRLADFAHQLTFTEDGDSKCRPPSEHHGYNLLLTCWKSSEDRLKNIYGLFRKLSGAVEGARVGERVIVYGASKHR